MYPHDIDPDEIAEAMGKNTPNGDACTDCGSSSRGGIYTGDGFVCFDCRNRSREA